MIEQHEKCVLCGDVLDPIRRESGSGYCKACVVDIMNP